MTARRLADLLDGLRRDAVYAWRRMRAAPAFTAVVVAILAVAIGANVAVFNVVDAVLLRALPVDQPHQLRELAWIDRRESSLPVVYSGSTRPFSANEVLASSFSFPVYAHLRAHSTVFEELFLLEQRPLSVEMDGGRQQVSGVLASGNFLPGLGVKMAIGRSFLPDDDRADAPPVAVLTQAFWQRAYGRSPDVLGRTLSMNGTPAVIVGVIAGPFDGVEPGAPSDLMLPMIPGLRVAGEVREWLANSRQWRFRVIGRVKGAVSDALVQAETERLVRQAIVDSVVGGDEHQLPRVVVSPGGHGSDGLRRTYERPLYLLAGIMAVVLLMACANIAGLLLVRGASREREMVLRLALGAGRGRLMRQVLTESALLAWIGGALGAALACAVRGGVLPVLNQGRAPSVSLEQGPSSLIVSIALCVVVGLLCGLLPAVRAPRPRLLTARAVGGRVGGRSHVTGANALIALQVALSLVLIVGAGLFVRTLINLRSQAIGFRPDHLLLFELDPSQAGYENARLQDFYARALERIAGIPGVRAASLSRHALLSGGHTTDTIVVPGAPAGQDEIRVHLHFVSHRHLETMGVALRAGRDLTAQDRSGAPRVALANQALARLLSGSDSAVGRQILYARPDSTLEIVGIAADARFATLRDPAPPTLYLPYRQYPQRRMTFAARATGDPLALAAPVRRALAELDANVPMLAIRTQEAQIDAAVQRERTFARVASGCGVLALTLACLGIYGTLSYSVSRRTAEIGLRMALGAGRRQVVVLVGRDALLPVALGLAVGVAIVAMTTRFLQSMLFGLSAHDGPTLAFAMLALVASAGVAAWLPCRRASRVDPMVALRAE